jgi:hypothetical protein
MYRWAFVSEGMENNNFDGMVKGHSEETKGPNQLVNGNESTTNPDKDTGKSSPTLAPNCQKHLYHQDFVPYVVRVARLLLQKV